MANQDGSKKPQTLKYLTLTLVTLQTTVTVLVLRYSRLKSSDGTESKHYFGSTLVLLAEIVKFVLCILLLLFQNGCSVANSAKMFYQEVLLNRHETSKLAIPSTLYTIQNNLLIIALSNLDAATYQVTYQLKILTTALFSVLLMKKQLSGRQWGALFLLMIGVIFVQLPTERSNSGETLSLDSTQRLIGLGAVLISCLSSGYAGVYYEKLVKEGTQPSVIIRNLQLSIFSLFFASVGVMVTDWENVRINGFFFGYSSIVWTVIMLQAVGGLIVAATVKYADNILKGFATSLSIILSSMYSYLILNDLQISVVFVYGTLLVISATFLYGLSPKKVEVRSSEERELMSDKKAK